MQSSFSDLKYNAKKKQVRRDCFRGGIEAVTPWSELLAEQGLLIREGTILITAPPSTKNRDKALDPDMHQTKKGNQWYFG